jgi:hypothetical protein
VPLIIYVGKRAKSNGRQIREQALEEAISLSATPCNKKTLGLLPRAVFLHRLVETVDPIVSTERNSAARAGAEIVSDG